MLTSYYLAATEILFQKNDPKVVCTVQKPFWLSLALIDDPCMDIYEGSDSFLLLAEPQTI